MVNLTIAKLAISITMKAILATNFDKVVAIDNL